MILVFCPRGHIFESRAFHFGGNAINITLSGNRESCPVCGAMANIMDGTFDIIDGVTHVLSAPHWTLERLHSLRAVLERLPTTTTRDDIARVLETDAPDLKQAIPTDPSRLREYMAILLVVIGFLIAHHDAAVAHHDSEQQSQQIEKMDEDIVRAIIAHSAQTPTTPPPPRTTTQRGHPPRPRKPNRKRRPK
jgi:hypothetical protein